MRRLLTLGLVTVAALIGCSHESQRGGPGASGTSTAGRGADNRAETFTVAVPSTTTSVAPGQREEVTISIDRGSQFKQPVKLQFKAPPGMKVVPEEAEIQPGDTSTKVFVEATGEGTPGKAYIEVVGVPQSGKSVSVRMPVEIKKKD